MGLPVRFTSTRLPKGAQESRLKPACPDSVLPDRSKYSKLVMEAKAAGMRPWRPSPCSSKPDTCPSPLQRTKGQEGVAHGKFQPGDPHMDNCAAPEGPQESRADNSTALTCDLLVVSTGVGSVPVGPEGRVWGVQLAGVCLLLMIVLLLHA